MNEPTLKDYDVVIRWDDRGGYFVAEAMDFPGCAADGATQEEALANLRETFAVLKEFYTEDRKPMPAPDKLPVSIDRLSRLRDLLKISKVAELVGMSEQTLASRIQRGKEFEPSESMRVHDALTSYGIIVMPTPIGDNTAYYAGAAATPGWSGTEHLKTNSHPDAKNYLTYKAHKLMAPTKPAIKTKRS